MELDHVLIAVADLQAASRTLEERHGLASVEGGRHAGWGTANRIVPLGDTYIELIAVVDEREAAGSAFGRWVASAIASGAGRPMGWVARTKRLAEVAERLGLTVSSGSRPGREGRVLRWRLAGVDEAAAEPALPFFVEWGERTPLPGRTEIEHPAGAARLERLELSGDAGRVTERLGTEDMPISVIPGPPAGTGLVLAGDEGVWTINRL